MNFEDSKKKTAHKTSNGNEKERRRLQAILNESEKKRKDTLEKVDY